MAAATAAKSGCAAASKSSGARLTLGSRLPDAGADACVRVDEWLATCIPQHEIGEGILAQVEADFGSGLARLNADWSVGWAELIGQVAELETERAKLIAASEAGALG